MLELAVVVGVVVVLDVAALLVGVDTRDGNDWATHTRP